MSASNDFALVHSSQSLFQKLINALVHTTYIVSHGIALHYLDPHIAHIQNSIAISAQESFHPLFETLLWTYFEIHVLEEKLL